MSPYVFESVWPEPSQGVQREVVDFWLSESALPEGKAIERARQLLVVCRDRDAKLAGVSTVVPMLVQSLGLRCFYFRAFVGQQYRTRGLRSSRLIHRLVVESHRVLNERFQGGVDQDCLGLYLEIENPSIQRHRNELVWTDDGANVVLVGILPNGNHARVWYFDQARLPKVGRSP